MRRQFVPVRLALLALLVNVTIAGPVVAVLLSGGGPTVADLTVVGSVLLVGNAGVVAGLVRSPLATPSTRRGADAGAEPSADALGNS